MDSSERSGTLKPPFLLHRHHHHRFQPLFPSPHPPPHHHHHHHCNHHHHHHIHFSPHCPLHSHLLQPNPHPQACPKLLSFHNQSDLQPPLPGEIYPSDALMMHEGNEEVIEEDDDDPIFVLTDEWRDFFAKSEAKRRAAKKQAKKKGKAQVKA